MNHFMITKKLVRILLRGYQVIVELSTLYGYTNYNGNLCVNCVPTLLDTNTILFKILCTFNTCPYSYKILQIGMTEPPISKNSTSYLARERNSNQFPEKPNLKIVSQVASKKDKVYGSLIRIEKDSDFRKEPCGSKTNFSVLSDRGI